MNRRSLELPPTISIVSMEMSKLARLLDVANEMMVGFNLTGVSSERIDEMDKIQSLMLLAQDHAEQVSLYIDKNLPVLEGRADA